MKIAIDLTPVQPGGLNGGAKPLVLDLVQCLVETAPDDEFLFLTSDVTDVELSFLDAPNARRMCMIERRPTRTALPPANAGPVSLKRRVRFALTRVLPPDLMLWIERAYLFATRQRPKHTGLLSDLGIDLLFSPFTALYFYEPRIPSVSLVHDLQVFTYPRFFTPEQRASRVQDFLRAASRAERLVCTSEYVRDKVLAHAQVALEWVPVINPRMARRLPAVDTASQEKVLMRFGLREGEFLLYPANFWTHKNHAMLLTALGILRANRPDLPLKLVCPGEHSGGFGALRCATEAMHLNDQVLFPGFVTDAELAALYQSCLAVVFPSLYEGFGLPVLEAMAFGAPVLCSRATSLPEVAGDAALYFDPRKPDDIARAVEQVATDEQLRHRLTEAGSERAEQYADLGQTAREYLALFRELVRVGEAQP
ncbi:MAG: glycosyltransferase family 4 protein [Chloroflexi bacterium]|nr:glycosyltransferase family 4 protein [Chloroflexota bacterium]